MRLSYNNLCGVLENVPERSVVIYARTPEDLKNGREIRICMIDDRIGPETGERYLNHARLMKAAPMLLVALRDLLSRYHATVDHEWPGDQGEERMNRKECIAARAVLAQIDGE